MVEKKVTNATGAATANRSIWKFFGSLFGAPERLGDPLGPYVSSKSSGGGGGGSEGESGAAPALTTMRARSSAERRARHADVFDGDTM